MRKLTRLLFLLCLPLLLSSCAPGGDGRYSREYYGCFDTQTRLTAYAASEEDFTALYNLVAEELARLHRLFDIYHDYEGINNIKTINDNAGIAPVAIAPELMELLRLCKEAYTDTGGALNAALGPVLSLWHDARETGALPESGALAEAAERIDLDCLVLDGEAGTAYLSKAGMRLDVGASAKGYAAQKALEAARNAGYDHLLLDVGRNIAVLGSPPAEGRTSWSIGIQDPLAEGDESAYICIVYVRDAAVVTSGNYQRYVVIDNVRYHHIIDPGTLYPAERYVSVSIIHEDSAAADMLSTALFVLSPEEGRALLTRYGGEALWLYSDGTREETEGWAAYCSP